MNIKQWFLRESPSPEGALEWQVPWPPLHVLNGFFWAYGLTPFFLSSLLQTVVPSLDELTVFGWMQFSVIMAWFAFWWISSRYYRVSVWTGLGLVPLPSWPRLCLGMGVGVVGVLLILGFFMVLSEQFEIPVGDPYQDFPEPTLALISLFAVFASPFMEELAFRGFFQTTLTHYSNVWLGIVGTALAFTFLHGHYGHAPLAMANVLAIGIFLGWVRYRFASVIPAIAGHLANNLLAAGAVTFGLGG